MVMLAVNLMQGVKVRKFLVVVCGLLLTFLTSLTQAGEVTGKVVFMSSSASYMYFSIDSSAGYSSCSQATKVFYFPISNDAGKIWVSMLLAAKSSGQTATVLGGGSCNVNGYESVVAVKLGG